MEKCYFVVMTTCLRLFNEVYRGYIVPIFNRTDCS